MTPINILYDGWALVYQPNSPAAMHLLTILEALPEEVSAVVAVPAEPPDWIPDNPKFELFPSANTSRSQLKWEQRSLPEFAQKFDAHLIHRTAVGASMLNARNTLISPTGYGANERRSTNFTERWRQALGRGGQARAKAVLWPEDLSANKGSLSPLYLPPVVHPEFTPTELDEPPDIPGIDLPETYFLYHGPLGFNTLRKVLDSWSWAAKSIGQFYPLLLAGTDAEARSYMEYLLPDYGLEGNIIFLPALSPADLSVVYQHCSGLFHPAGASPWGGPIRRALACGRSVVSLESEMTETLVGSAAFLVTEDNPRLLGSGLISIVVKDEIAIELEKSALVRSQDWGLDIFRNGLRDIYRGLSF